MLDDLAKMSESTAFFTSKQLSDGAASSKGSQNDTRSTDASFLSDSVCSSGPLEPATQYDSRGVVFISGIERNGMVGVFRGTAGAILGGYVR